MSSLNQSKTFNCHPKYQVKEVSQAQFLAALREFRQKDAKSTYISDLEVKFLAQMD